MAARIRAGKTPGTKFVAELILTLKGREMKRFKIGKTVLTIGRDPDNDVVIENPGVSRRHATLRFENERFLIHDEASANGILVNDVRVQEESLMPGDRIGLGKFVLRFEDSSPSEHGDLEFVSSRPFRARLAVRHSPQATTIVDPQEVAAMLAMRRPTAVVPVQEPRPVDTQRTLPHPEAAAKQVAAARRLPVQPLKLAVIALGGVVLALAGVVIWLASK
jgi:predicted component of type VI protein secretion system